jgi:RNA polymerase sigma-70 factor, ECF subfamily
MTAADEQLLVSRAKSGDHGAFRELVERHMKQAYDIAYGFVRDHDAAEDVTQEAFVRAYESLKGFRGDAAFGTWLYRIVSNLSINQANQMRRHTGRHVRDLTPADLVPAGDHESVGEHDVRGHIERALHELPTLQRAVVLLRHFEGLSTRQVSVILRCSEGTVKTHLFRGLEKMRDKLQHLREEDQ